jgi:hypothetical protein
LPQLGFSFSGGGGFLRGNHEWRHQGEGEYR